MHRRSNIECASSGVPDVICAATLFGHCRTLRLPQDEEVLIGGRHRIVLGALVGLVAFLWKGDPIIGAVLSLAMFGTLLVAAVTGTLLPLFLRWLKIDPALASSVFVTTATDVTGFLLFLGLGALALARF